MRGKRWLLALAMLGLAVALLCGTATGLRLRHDAALWLARFTAVAMLDIERVGVIRMFLNPDDTVVTTAIMANGVWEENETHWFTRFVGPGDTVVDVGANVGYYTLLAARLVGDEGRVYAFEPDPVSFALLQRNVRLNGMTNVVAEQKAVSNRDGTLRLFLAAENKGDHRIYDPGEARPAIEVEAVRLDDYLRGAGGRVDFVKIDTRGAEGLIVDGLAETIAANPEIVMAVEFSPGALAELGTDPAALLGTLRRHDFRMFDLGPGMPGLLPLREVRPAGLVENYGSGPWPFTNLLLVKGFAELRRLTWDVEGKRRALETAIARGRDGSDQERPARSALALAEAALVEFRDGVARHGTR